MKPLLLKAGISAAISSLAYICVKIMSKHSNSSHEKGSHSNPSLHDESFNSLDNLEDKSSGREGNLVGKLLELETQLEELIKEQECGIEMRIVEYEKMKERELVLLEMRNVLVLEKIRVEFLMKEILLLEDEYKRIEELVILYMKLVDEVKGLKEMNRLLETKAKKQLEVTKNEQNLSIELKDEELLSNGKEMEKQGNYIKELEGEIGQLKMDVGHLQRENIDLYNKLQILENLDSSNFKTEAEMVTKEEYDKVLKELEQFQQQTQKLEANEITYLKWSNACLRHELVKYHEHLDHTNSETGRATNQDHCHPDSNWSHDDEPCSSRGPSDAVGHRVRSRRRRIIQKFKRWVDGSGKMDDNNNNKEKDEEMNDNKCFGCHSVSDDVQSRKSCSSI